MADEVNFEDVFCELSTLLDAIEIALDEEDYEKAERLVASRFRLVEKHGLTVEITGVLASGRLN